MSNAAREHDLGAKLLREVDGLCKMHDAEMARRKLAEARLQECERKLAQYDRMVRFVVRMRVLSGASEADATEWVHTVVLREPSP